MNAYEQEVISLIETISIQLMLFAVGAFSLVASILAGRTKATKHKWALVTAAIFLLASTFLGVVTLGATIHDLDAAASGIQVRFDPWSGPIRFSYLGQLAALFFGACFFTYYVVCNVP